MKDNLITDLEGLFCQLVDYRSRLLHHLLDTELCDEMKSSQIAKIKNIRSSLSYVEDLCTEVKEAIDQQVYLVQVTSTVDMNIKVLAKNEDDAIEWATQVADKRVYENLESKFDCYYDSTGEVLGHEPPEDDEADEEYPYDG